MLTEDKGAPAGAEEGKAVKVVWVIPESVAGQYATHFVVQQTDQELILSFFEARPPFLLGTEEERRRQIEAIEGVPAVCFARIVMTPQRAAELLAALGDNLRRVAEAREQAREDRKE